MKKIVIRIIMVFLFGIILLFITNIDSTEASTTTLAQTVINLSQGSSWSSGASGVYYTNSHEYRYVGANVNNYIRFNDDMYQIIGVFDNSSTGVNGNLVKLIRSRSIGAYSWGVTNDTSTYTTYSTYDNNWETANANILLNEYFLNATGTSTTYGSCDNWTYFSGGNNYKTQYCDKIIGYGIRNANLRNYIQPVTWYLKGYDAASYSKQDFYTCERSDTTTITNCTSGDSGAFATKVTNKKIGLMYASDFLYASGYYASDDTTAANGYQQHYGQQNWLFNGVEWTITPRGLYNNYAFNISQSASAYFETSSNSRVIRPTFYLKADVYVTGGNGSFANPYTIACDTCNS